MIDYTEVPSERQPYGRGVMPISNYCAIVFCELPHSSIHIIVLHSVSEISMYKHHNKPHYYLTSNRYVIIRFLIRLNPRRNCMKRHLTSMLVALFALIIGTGMWFMPTPISAQGYAPEAAPATRKLVLELRGKPLHWLSFSIAEYYIDNVNQENGSRARNIINGHMNRAIWRFYDDGTLEFVGGTGMPAHIRNLSGTYEYDIEREIAYVYMGTMNLEPGMTVAGAGFTGWYDPAASNVMLGYAANYTLNGYWQTVVGSFGQDMTVTYAR